MPDDAPVTNATLSCNPLMVVPPCLLLTVAGSTRPFHPAQVPPFPASSSCIFHPTFSPRLWSPFRHAPTPSLPRPRGAVPHRRRDRLARLALPGPAWVAPRGASQQAHPSQTG